MFVGHYAASFYIKARKPEIPLWVLLLAVQLVDVAWALLVLAGIEQLAMVPGITRASPLDLVYVPYTHSLVAVLGWSLLASWLWYRTRGSGGTGRGAAVLVGLAVLSHWLGDLLVHRPDLPLYDNSAKVGLGLWNYPVLSFPLEIGLLAWAMWAWYRASRRAANGRNLVLLWLVMAASQVFTNFGPLPVSPDRFVLLALAFYLAFALASRTCDAPPSATAA
jgi:hypothetical protein